MESYKFDALVRSVQRGASRRGVLRAGIGTMLLSAALRFDVGLFDAEAKKRKKHKKKKPQKCGSSAPIQCGSGCCISQFPNCCADAQSHDSLCFPGGYSLLSIGSRRWSLPAECDVLPERFPSSVRRVRITRI